MKLTGLIALATCSVTVASSLKLAVAGLEKLSLESNGTTLTPGTSNSTASSSSIARKEKRRAWRGGEPPQYNITEFVFSANSETATCSFKLAFWPGQPEAPCALDETGGFAHYPDVWGHCKRPYGYGNADPLTGFYIYPGHDGSRHIEFSSIFMKDAGWCSGCSELALGTLPSESFVSEGESGGAGQRYVGPASFSLPRYLDFTGSTFQEPF